MVYPRQSDALTKEELEAIDADIAFEMMQKEFSQLGIDPSSRVNIEEADAAYARQLELEENQGIVLRMPPARSDVVDRTAIRTNIGTINSPNPRVETIQPSRPAAALATPAQQCPIERLPLSQRINTIINDLGRNLAEEFEVRSNLKHIVICGENKDSRMNLALDIARRGKFKARRIANDTFSVGEASFGLQNGLNSLKKPFHGADSDLRIMIIIEPEDLIVGNHGNVVQAHLLDLIKNQTRKNCTVAILISNLEVMNRAYFAHCLRGKADLVHLDTIYPEVRTQTSHVARTSSGDSSNSSSASTSTSSTPAPTRLPSPDENNAATHECPICIDKQTDMNTPCCLTKICQDCWEDSLRATAQAGYGGHARQCPFCKVEESRWLAN